MLSRRRWIVPCWDQRRDRLICRVEPPLPRRRVRRRGWPTLNEARRPSQDVEDLPSEARKACEDRRSQGDELGVHVCVQEVLCVQEGCV